jgi:hypothetical protein
VEAEAEADALGPKLGIPLTLLLEETTDVRLELAAAEGVAEGPIEALDDFFCSAGAGAGVGAG